MASNPNLREGAAREIANRLAGPVAEKYQRPANVEKFMKDSFDYQRALNAGGVKDSSGVLNLLNKNFQLTPGGATVLKMNAPSMTAMQPTMGQAGGDFLRGLGSFVRDAGKELNPLSFIPGANLIMSGLGTARDIFFPDPPVVRTGSNTTGTVTEEPINSGVIDVMPNAFFTQLKQKPNIPEPFGIEAVDNPALYGDGNFFDDFRTTLAKLGLDS
tara:strand:+ start:19253 stop:19897 length:645 start_codon:yes stop_codon:yes gene_type:complete